MSTFKYQTEFAADLAKAWLEGKHEHVRTLIRNLKNKAQAAYIEAAIVIIFCAGEDRENATAFVDFMHPNNR